MSSPLITLTPKKAGIDAAGGTLDVLLRVQSPPMPEKTERRERPPIHLALVLDRSSSMSGAPIIEAKKCAQKIVERLGVRDKAAIVSFSDSVHTLSSLVPVAPAGRLLSAIEGIEASGNTNLHGGWLQGAQELAAQSEGGALSRVVLLSDGQANEGIVDPQAIFAQCRELTAAGISTTTIGLGHSFNEDLMVGMAKAGQGQHYYGQSAKDLYDAFLEELELTEALHSTGLHATLVPGPGVIVEILSKENVRADAPIPLSDLAFGAEAWLLVRLHYSAKPVGSHALLSVSVSGKAVGGATFTTAPALLELPVLNTTGLALLPADALVGRRQAEALSARLLLAFRSRLSSGDRQGAEQALAELKALGREHAWIGESVAELEELLRRDEAMARKEALYTSSRLQDRLAPVAEEAYRSDETAAPAGMPVFLRRKAVQGRGKTDK
ncbi:MAG: VWA domain-containing protein [Armatimonas sp.]